MMITTTPNKNVLIEFVENFNLGTDCTNWQMQSPKHIYTLLWICHAVMLEIKWNVCEANSRERLKTEKTHKTVNVVLLVLQSNEYCRWTQHNRINILKYTMCNQDNYCYHLYCMRAYTHTAGAVLRRTHASQNFLLIACIHWYLNCLRITNKNFKSPRYFIVFSCKCFDFIGFQLIFLWAWLRLLMVHYCVWFFLNIFCAFFRFSFSFIRTCSIDRW